MLPVHVPSLTASEIPVRFLSDQSHYLVSQACDNFVTYIMVLLYSKPPMTTFYQLGSISPYRGLQDSAYAGSTVTLTLLLSFLIDDSPSTTLASCLFHEHNHTTSSLGLYLTGFVLPDWNTVVCLANSLTSTFHSVVTFSVRPALTPLFKIAVCPSFHIFSPCLPCLAGCFFPPQHQT